MIDFVAAVAVGTIVGRTAIADGQSCAAGAVALVTILAVPSYGTEALASGPLAGAGSDLP